MKLIEFSVRERKDPNSDINVEMIESDYCNSSATCFKVTLILASYSTDTLYTSTNFWDLSSKSYRVRAYDNPELLGKPYPIAWTISNPFWEHLDNGNYKFIEYFENTPVVVEILKAISTIVNNPSLDTVDDSIMCNLLRLLRALENFWDY
jgi:hypothetical protein